MRRAAWDTCLEEICELNNQVGEITKDFDKLLLSDEFKEDNEREKSKSTRAQAFSLRFHGNPSGINSGRGTRCTDISSHSRPSRIYTGRMIRLGYKSGQITVNWRIPKNCDAAANFGFSLNLNWVNG